MGNGVKKHTKVGLGHVVEEPHTHSGEMSKCKEPWASWIALEIMNLFIHSFLHSLRGALGWLSW